MVRIASSRLARGRRLALLAGALVLAAASAHRAEAVSLISPAATPAAKASSEGVTTEVRHGGGGFHGGHIGGGGRVGGFHGARIGGFPGGGFRAAPIYRSHIGAYRYGGYRYAGYPYFRRHHFHRRFFVGGYYPYYPYYAYPWRRCRIVWTYWGPRRVCRWPRPWWARPYGWYW